jgi:hypothetical protein
VHGAFGGSRAAANPIVGALGAGMLGTRQETIQPTVNTVNTVNTARESVHLPDNYLDSPARSPGHSKLGRRAQAKKDAKAQDSEFVKLKKLIQKRQEVSSDI